MKYKIIKSFAHNFTHSFVSWENKVADCIIIEELKAIARNLDGGRVVIVWIPEDHNAPLNPLFSPAVIESIARYRTLLPQHASRHRVELACLEEMRTEIYRKPNHQLAVESVAVDDRGREYRSSVDF